MALLPPSIFHFFRTLFFPPTRPQSRWAHRSCLFFFARFVVALAPSPFRALRTHKFRSLLFYPPSPPLLDLFQCRQVPVWQFPSSGTIPSTWCKLAPQEAPRGIQVLPLCFPLPTAHVLNTQEADKNLILRPMCLRPGPQPSFFSGDSRLQWS